MPMTFLILVILSASAYRVGRFITLDTLIEGTRDRFANWLTTRNSLWAEKLLDLISCPWCVTIWTGFGATAYWTFAIEGWTGWWFPLHWLAVSTGGVLLWTIIDSD